MTSADDRVYAEHQARLQGLDPLLRAPPLVATDGQEVLRAERNAATAVGLAVRSESAPSDPTALWGALRTHSLSIRVAGADREAGVSGLLDVWDEHLPTVAVAGDDDTAAAVRWPSRDLAGPRSLIRHGFAALTTVAVRGAGRAGPPSRAAVTVRVAGPADLDSLTDFAEELLRADVPWGVLTERPAQRKTMRAGLSESLAEGDLVLVAELDGAAVGYVAVSTGERAAWMAPLVNDTPMAYLSSLYVAEGARSRGVGEALAAAAHTHLDDAGVSATLLHYALPSPVSVPFWSRLGYRPLWTLWQRRPAVR